MTSVYRNQCRDGQILIAYRNNSGELATKVFVSISDTISWKISGGFNYSKDTAIPENLKNNEYCIVPWDYEFTK